MRYYIVWNEERTEGVIFDNEADARSTVTGAPNCQSGFPSMPSVGEAFRDLYDEDEFTLQEIEMEPRP